MDADELAALTSAIMGITRRLRDAGDERDRTLIISELLSRAEVPSLRPHVDRLASVATDLDQAARRAMPTPTPATPWGAS